MSEGLDKILIAIDRREDYVKRSLVERLYESAVERRDFDRAEYLLDRLTNPATPTKRVW